MSRAIKEVRVIGGGPGEVKKYLKEEPHFVDSDKPRLFNSFSRVSHVP